MATHSATLPQAPGGTVRRVGLRHILWAALLIYLLIASPVVLGAKPLLQLGWTLYPRTDLDGFRDFIHAAAFDANEHLWVGTIQGRLFHLYPDGA